LNVFSNDSASLKSFKSKYETTLGSASDINIKHNVIARKELDDGTIFYCKVSGGTNKSERINTACWS
jgi:hypothetical protein